MIFSGDVIQNNRRRSSSEGPDNNHFRPIELLEEDEMDLRSDPAMSSSVSSSTKNSSTGSGSGRSGSTGNTGNRKIVRKDDSPETLSSSEEFDEELVKINNARSR